ncbi:carboxypeptidase-like regulatory domain-containing protein, partial [Acidobacteria bacterium AH-259-O06]|nr:carboxypeptidase-like regulatory domain-containing protein [Acidobacteria bacterium AH-259-O06]
VELPGFKTARRAGIILQVGRTARVDMTLQVGEATELVEVYADTSMVHTEESGLGQVVGERQLADLPLTGGGGRNYLSLLLLSAGVSSQPGLGYALNNARINGGRPRADDYLLDGTSIQQIVFGGTSITPAVDSLQEFTVETNSYPAEYGRISGGIVSAITRSGSNEYHGSVYELFRNDVLDARNFFLPADEDKDVLRQNEFGFTFGGPIVKDKLFFFGDYQGFRRSGETVFTNRQVPLVAFKQGDFSSLLGSQVGVDPCGRAVFQGAIYNPTTERVAAAGDPTCLSGSGGELVRDPFSGNIIPSSMFSPAASSFLPLWPDPNRGGANFSRVAPAGNDVDRFDIRGDYHPSEQDSLFFVFHYQNVDGKSAQAFPDPRATGNKGFAGTSKASTFAWNHNFGPTMINEFRFGWTDQGGGRRPAGFGEVGPSDFGISGFPECSVIPEANGKCGTPQISVSGFQGLGSGGILFEPKRILQFSDSLSKVKGSHNIKFGTDIRHFRIQNYQPNSINGSFSFLPTQTQLPGFAGDTGFAFASFLLGRLNNGGALVQEDWLQTTTMSYSFYVQDSWKLRPGFTLNYGIRYQVDLPWREKNNQAARQISII